MNTGIRVWGIGYRRLTLEGIPHTPYPNPQPPYPNPHTPIPNPQSPTPNYYLLAVSGGIDSMVMAHLFVNSGFKCAIAHCNFSLRGDESDADEELVRTFADECGVPFHTIRFDTNRYAAEKKISTQLAARELRYNWFEELKNTYGFDKIVIAHNSDDNLETFFINLSRGAGLNGLTGIPKHTDNLIRPLLNFSRKEIEEYAVANNVRYREDSSNLSDKYLRNKLRHLVLPVLDGVIPSFREKVLESIGYLNQANNFFEAETEIFLHDNSFEKHNDIYISLDKIRQSHSKEIRLFYILKTYGFRRETIEKICECVDKAVSGKQFFSSTHCLLIDRTHLIISPANEKTDSYVIDKDSVIYTDCFELRCETVEKDSAFQLLRNPNVGEFDLAKLTFPLIFRPCNEGDCFVPLGMKGHKKLSDFFIDLKLPVTEKKRQQVLVSGNDIIWVAGLRPDERFKVTENTRKVLRVWFKRN
ncbi:MAG: tRNA lysidine(34) synthetase TilS [Prevotellaceae bacterium]|jgi:tRNA(Ile)-lysidine synthase|nr:tRNA lysidine(34) synthetase TilS [Prevotellaceae bacterium]